MWFMDQSLDVRILAILIGLALLGFQALLLALAHYGVKAFQKWFTDTLVVPHISPMQEDLATIKDQQLESTKMLTAHSQQLADHTAKWEKVNTWTLLLLGKVFGGIPNLDVVSGLEEEATITKMEEEPNRKQP